MYILPRSNYLRRGLLVHKSPTRPAPAFNPISHAKRIKQSLKNLGVTRLGLTTLESKYLPKVIHPEEELGGVVYGLHENGFAMLAATDRRIIFLDKKPMFVNSEEVTYDVVSGISFSQAGMGAMVTLNTRVKDYTIKTLNKKCADGFVEYIEARCLEHNEEGDSYDRAEAKRKLQAY